MSEMVIKFTSLAQLQAHQFISEDDRLCLEGLRIPWQIRTAVPSPRLTQPRDAASTLPAGQGCATIRSDTDVLRGTWSWFCILIQCADCVTLLAVCASSPSAAAAVDRWPEHRTGATRRDSAGSPHGL